jgi:hypothetical protein
MAEFIQKSDYPLNKQGVGEENNAYGQAMELFLGNE